MNNIKIYVLNLLYLFRMFKDKPSKKTVMNLQSHNWIIKKLPKNPYLK